MDRVKKQIEQLVEIAGEDVLVLLARGDREIQTAAVVALRARGLDRNGEELVANCERGLVLA